LRGVPVLAALLALVLLAGCGEDSPPEKPSGPTQAEFVADADLICRQVNEAVAERGFDQAFDRITRGLQQLRRLQAPPDLELRFEQYVTAIEQQTNAQLTGDLGAARAADKRKERAAFALGFADCGTG
jgi:uncharacterized lipoprotein YajG